MDYKDIERAVDQEYIFSRSRVPSTRIKIAMADASTVTATDLLLQVGRSASLKTFLPLLYTCKTPQFSESDDISKMH